MAKFASVFNVLYVNMLVLLDVVMSAGLEVVNGFIIQEGFSIIL